MLWCINKSKMNREKTSLRYTYFINLDLERALLELKC